MPGRGDGPDAGGDETLSRIRLIGLLVGVCVGATACNGAPETPPPALAFEVEFHLPEEKVTYGQIVPMDLTITNDNDVPAFVLRVETLRGSRRQLWAAPDGMLRLAPRAKVEIKDASYRLIERQEQILITYRNADPEHPDRPIGLERALRVPVEMPCPEFPFSPDFWDRKLESWTWSEALDGFVLRLNAEVFLLATEKGDEPLPPLVFEFLRDIDENPEKPVGVLMTNGRIRRVDAKSLRAFLDEVNAAGHQILFSDGGEDAPYEEKE